MKFFFLTAVLGLALVATLVANWTLRSDIEHCANVVDPAERLRCFDRMAVELEVREDHDKIGR